MKTANVATDLSDNRQSGDGGVGATALAAWPPLRRSTSESNEATPALCFQRQPATTRVSFIELRHASTAGGQAHLGASGLRSCHIRRSPADRAGFAYCDSIAMACGAQPPANMRAALAIGSPNCCKSCD